MPTKSKWTKKEKDIITQYVAKYKEILFLNGWEIVTVFVNELESSNEDNTQVNARSLTLVEYRHIKIKFSHTIFEDKTVDPEDVVLHELCHSIPEALSDLIHNLQNGKLVTEEAHMKVNESVTSWITSIIYTLVAKNS